MFTVNDDLSIYVTRGDVLFFSVGAVDKQTGTPYVFKNGDVVRVKVYGKKAVEDVYLQKDFPVLEEKEKVEIYLSKEDTKIGDYINSPKEYWYDIELNPETDPQTLIGYTEDGAAVFRLYPEGGDLR